MSDERLIKLEAREVANGHRWTLYGGVLLTAIVVLLVAALTLTL